ncbi:MAG: uncharacterized protein PWP41_63 [Moorella sp. (in: firmicutes)]|nr:uncharacterized protein [Moorella sp. (in: firmicutes)]
MDVLIVDGYNLLHNWPELTRLKESSFEHARDKLITELINYQAYWGGKVIVVFDAHKVPGAVEKREKLGGVEVIYSREGETADTVIERLVGDLIATGRVYVATSDWAEQRMILGKGALRLPARELKVNLEQARQEIARASKGNSGNGRLDTRIHRATRKILERWRRG